MNIEDVLNFTDSLVFAKKGIHLTDLQRTIIQAASSGLRHGYEEIAQANGYSPNYLKQDVGPKLWQLLSDVFGEKIKKNNFRTTVERQVSLLETPRPNLVEKSDKDSINHQEKICLVNQWQDWGDAPDVSIFYDRTEELAQLEQWIINAGCRIVGLVGMGGIGKTHLSAKLAEQIQEQFDYVIWRSLCNAPSPQQILDCWLQFIAKSQGTDLPEIANDKLSVLIDYLRKHRCLLILDDVETVLCDGDSTGFYKQSYEYYGEILKRLGECRHNSCLLLISREKPKEIALMQGETLPVRCLNLRGLSVSAGLKILQLKDCYCNSEAECRVLIEQYSGNPLALKMVAAEIRELFEGDVAEFLKYNTLVIEEIRPFLEQHLIRLSELGKTIFYWLAINRKPVSINELQSDIYPYISQQALIKSIKSLVQSSLIETKDNQFYLQQVLVEYVSSLLIERVCEEIETGELFFLKNYALLKTEAEKHIRKAQISFIVEPVIEKLLVVFQNKSNLLVHLKEIISKEQANLSEESGYVVGNIQNLLCQLL
ncbi:MAG: hypothetical protein KME64_22865 [Scytonematopsis contorta HA4267-MV1]|jgi:DNA-binding HxlR family transcriptional regulator|nr:hypothetical protein [Scytonematopsis contorta HA4267-MV1]